MRSGAFWKAHEIREHIDVVSNRLAPTLWLKNAVFLHPYLNQWVKSNIWIYKDRIIYVGNEEPEKTANTEIFDCKGLYLVPGYIEPHAHPFQLYNPHSLAQHVSQTGTTTLICDNLFLLLQFPKKKAFSFVEDMQSSPVQFFWWARYDLQTECREEDQLIPPDVVKQWIEHPAVIQGGELTGWPKLLLGDDLFLHWIHETKKVGKRVEGHFPGASRKTLTKMKLFGVDSDHESISGEEVYNRLLCGYSVPLRYSSIRPDLPKLLEELLAFGVNRFDEMFFTTDGSTPAFYENGMINQTIQIALEAGIPEFEAYKMATYNVARYYMLDSKLGVIGPGRLASINFLEAKNNPNPVAVLAKGKWIHKDGQVFDHFPQADWNKYEVAPLELDWDLTMDDLQFSMPMGLKMRNTVIIEPYSITIDNFVDELPLDHDESFLAVIDKKGKWRINTMLKGFAKGIKGFASTYSTTGDVVLIGKNKQDMMHAFSRLKEIGGGIVITENGQVIFEMPLNINGAASSKKFKDLIKEENGLVQIMREKGYKFLDPIHSLLFLSCTHLPYIRVTQEGIYDVMKKTILFPTIIR
ncbi:adenosine deaminase [Aeribacillus pallidus]|jgi:adenine deaminase|uniref:adenine deaminase n=1 Tax=Aeribacillus pallidus TaxID=33936 RepID=A0A165WZQ2_9BACI|nr:adenine deaminase C-terminal domain-containing protein [Aeribacillus pallidus]KZN95473.1 adenosine deaminase [Aeribacillus pallidus]